MKQIHFKNHKGKEFLFVKLPEGTEIVKTKDYILLVDKKAEIKGTVCLCYNSSKSTWNDDIVLYQGTMPDYHYNGFQKIIAYYPTKKEIEKIDLKLFDLPKGHDYKLIAPLSEMTEELWKGVVDKNEVIINRNSKPLFDSYISKDSLFETATQSGETLLQTRQIYSVNPFGEKPIRMVPFMSRGNYTENQIERIENFNIDLRNWQQTEENTGNWVLIQKIK